MKTFNEFYGNVDTLNEAKMSITGDKKSTIKEFALTETVVIKPHKIVGQVRSDAIELFIFLDDKSKITIVGGFDIQMEEWINVKREETSDPEEWGVENQYFKEMLTSHGMNFITSLIQFFFYPKMQVVRGKNLEIDVANIKMIS